MNLMQGMQRVLSEWTFLSSQERTDPFNEVELDAHFSGPGGEWRVPAFWGGGREWRVRFAPPVPGEYAFRTACSDESDAGLHGLEGRLVAKPYSGSNPLLGRGPLRVSANRRFLEHEDGTPFLWLGDTWWCGLTRRLRWPDGFQTLAADRVAKGFTVVQFCAGLFPEIDDFTQQGANEAGLAYEEGYRRINPAFYDMADLRVAHLVRCGLVPCVLGCWGYHVLKMGEERMLRHWRNLVARWGAWPVVWCLAGEGAMPWYLPNKKENEGHTPLQQAAWARVGRYVQETDPYDRLLTIHPRRFGRDEVEDDSVLDFEMLQTGHSYWNSAGPTVEAVRKARERTPTMPVVNGEVTYEAHQERNWSDIQRFMFWTCMLGGAAGITYGAGGMWQMNDREESMGASVHHPPYELTTWDEAMNLPGSAQMGLGAKFLARYPWWRFEPHPEWTDRPATPENYLANYAAGIPRKVRFVFLPVRSYNWNGPLLRHMEPGTRYRALYFDPVTGQEHPLGDAEGNAEGEWQAPKVLIGHDWVLVMERK